MSLSNRWLILVIVSIALFLIVVDMTILYTALPRLTQALGASGAQRLWIVSAYPLVVASLLPAAGALGDKYGHKPMFLAGLAVFGLASLAAAYAPAPVPLIGARATLAVGAALMMPATLAIIRHEFADPDERSLAIGIWAAVASGGAAFGPLAGGALLEHFWWGSVFLVNVPIVLATLPLAWLAIARRPGNRDQAWDLPGSILVMLGLLCLTYGIKEAGRPSAPLPGVLIALALGAVLLAAFARRQLRLASPMIDFRLFRNRVFSSGAVAAVVAAMALIGAELILSQRMQLVHGLSPWETGLYILPIPLASLVAGPAAGIAMRRLGAPAIIGAGLAASALGLAGYIGALGHSLGIELACLAVLGLGVGATMTGASSAMLLSAPAERVGMAASIEEVSYELGGALGIAALGSLMALLHGHAFVAPPGASGVPAAARENLDDALHYARSLPEGLSAQFAGAARDAFETAFNGTFLTAAALLAVTAAAVLLMQQRQIGRLRRDD
ncbi:MFS transporter [Verticiella sediminum]|uniref:MFS transporter n=1 Tax=Verticiella sediminum TaxID=1247510 RepID=A0A556ABX6_9BURK|nr:MFS transporter [Verticiella sediminum]TSH90396.1 MFS transporter [Verticiella sediminum]